MPIENVYDWENAFKSTCGPLIEGLKEDKFSTARAEITNRTEPHYHKASNELYIVLEGKGYLRIRDKDRGSVKEYDLNPSTEVFIESGNIHQAKPVGKLIVEAVNFPPWKEEDEVVVDESLF